MEEMPLIEIIVPTEVSMNINLIKFLLACVVKIAFYIVLCYSPFYHPLLVGLLSEI